MRYRAFMARNPTKRLYITLSVAMHDYLDALARRGTHGSNAADVARTLVEEGVRTAIKDGFIAMSDSTRSAERD